MNNAKKIMASVDASFIVFTAGANTDFLPIFQINYNGNADNVFFMPLAGK